METETKHRSPNGVFAIKLHFNQFENLFSDERNGLSCGMEFLNGFQKFILIYRQDKILQAISELLAEETQIWSTEDEKSQFRLGRSFEEPDIVSITWKMSRQIREEYGWRFILRDMEVDFHTVRYEDLENSPQHEFKRVNEYLGIAGMSSVHLKTRTKKLTDHSAALKMKQDYLHAIGGC